MKRIKKCKIMPVLLLFIGITSDAQMYSTQLGKILVNGKYNDSAYTATSDHLEMQISYDRAEMHMRLEVPTLVADNDSLNKLLQQLKGNKAHYTGKMNTNFIQTKSHPKQTIPTNGVISINGIKKPFGFSSILEHIAIGNISCTLTSKFVLDLNDFDIVTNPGENKVIVHINQLVLNRPGEN